MKISIVNSDTHHPIRAYLKEWAQVHGNCHDIELVDKVSQLSGGDILFLVSCYEIVSKVVRERYRATLVIHASDLPKGRGWSPHIWQILEGNNCIKVTILEAENELDTGAIWAQREVSLLGTELYDEINHLFFTAEIALMDEAIIGLSHIKPRKQSEITPSYYRRRNVEDSRIDPKLPLSEQFDILRVSDPQRFPAFFEWRGCCYEIQIKKMKDVCDD